MKPLRIFISSAQKEFSMERAVLRDYLRGDALMRRFFEPFLFEDVPAADRRADEQQSMMHNLLIGKIRLV
jgi:ATP-dependent DNA helicase RecG